MTAKAKWSAGAVVAVMLLALVNLPNPFTGDQSLFDIGGRMMAHGAVYYRDFWDIKQPGIYLFYELGGSIFGFTSGGIHLLELVWMTAFAVVLLYALRNVFRSPVALALSAVLTIGWYYVTVLAPGQTLVEGLVGFPIFVAAWATLRMADDDDDRVWQWALLAGLAMGVVAVFKLLLVAIVVWFWATALWRMARRRTASRRMIGALAIGAGASLLVVAPLIVYYAAHDTLGLVFRTTFVYPPQVARLGGMHSGDMLVRLVGTVVLTYAWLGVLAVVGVVWRARRRAMDPWTVNLLGWAVVAGLVVLVQRWSIYQGELLLVPMGVLAARTIDDLVSDWSPRRPRRATAGVVAGLAVLALLSMWYPARKADALLRNGFALSATDREGYRQAISVEYDDVTTDLEQFVGFPRPGSLYVLGHPLYSYLLDQDQPIALNGWSPDQWLDEQWTWFTEEIAEVKPTYLFIDEFGAGFLRAHAAAQDLVDSLYAPFASSPYPGTWYQLKTSA